MLGKKRKIRMYISNAEEGYCMTGNMNSQRGEWKNLTLKAKQGIHYLFEYTGRYGAYTISYTENELEHLARIGRIK